MKSKVFDRVFELIVIAILLVIIFITIFGFNDSMSIIEVFKDADKSNKNWTDWARFTGFILLVPLAVRVKRSVINGPSYFSKYSWYINFSLACFGGVLILLGSIF